MNKGDEFQDGDILNKYCSELMEHFDSVLILVTKHESKENGTTFDWRGKGNQFANSGAAKHWLEQDDERSRMCTRNWDEDENSI